MCKNTIRNAIWDGVRSGILGPIEYTVFSNATMRVCKFSTEPFISVKNQLDEVSAAAGINLIEKEK